MKKLFFVLLAIAIALPAFAAAPTHMIPKNRSVVPDGSGMKFLGQRMVSQKMKPNGSISMKGWQKGNEYQLITMSFSGETRPYCYWYSDMNGSSVGRCDVDNDGSYEYDFDGRGRTGHKLYFKPQWPTADE